MNYKKISIWAYLAVLVACVYSCTGYMIKNDPSEYRKTVKTIEYQMDYTDVYSQNIQGANAIEEVVVPAEPESEEKIVYLTFDDGPSKRTAEILDVLKEYNIQATFFVIIPQKEDDSQYLKRAVEEGHSIGIHSASHLYKKIYKSVDSFLSDFEECYNYIDKVTGEAPSIFRFPGGSVNNYNKSVRVDIAKEMKRRGFTYFDWNVSSGDAEKGYSEESIYNNIIKGCHSHNVSVVLMHDSFAKKDTVAALKRAIPVLLEEGYVFKGLDETAKPVIFKID